MNTNNEQLKNNGQEPKTLEVDKLKKSTHNRGAKLMAIIIIAVMLLVIAAGLIAYFVGYKR